MRNTTPYNGSAARIRRLPRGLRVTGALGVFTTLAVGGALLIAPATSGSAGPADNAAPAAVGTDQIAGGDSAATIQDVNFRTARTVKFRAMADLNARATASLSGKTVKVNAYRKGQNVPVVCQTKGGNAYGSTIWDKTTAGYYVADHYVKTGTNGFVSGLPKCTNVPQQPGGPTQPPSSSTVKGIDISAHQTGMNLAQQKAAGQQFVFIKATEGTSYLSSSFKSQRAGAVAAGMLYGAYHFANPAGASGAAQANYFIANGGNWTAGGKTLPGVLDIEFNPYRDGKGTCYGVSKTAMNKWIGEFLSTYKKRTGRDVIIYTATSWWKACTGNTSQFAGNPLWISNYSGSSLPLPNGWTKPLIWQHTSTPFDHNTFYGSMAALHTLATGMANSSTTPTNTPTTTPPTNTNGARVFKTTVALDGRNAKKVAAKRIKEYKSGATLHIKCQAYGEYAYGSPIWDKTGDDLWVPDHYVKTGVDGSVKGLARCDNDHAPKGPSTKGCIDSLNTVSCGQAVAWARAHVNKVDSDYDHMCDHITGLAYGHGASGSASAKSHWQHLPVQYRHPGDRTVPAGGLAFFDDHDFGHVMISLGNNQFLSNDIHGAGRLSVTTIHEVETTWHLHYAGWGQPWFQANH